MNLNLLLALDALLAELNVTRAAQRAGLTQPGMSHALARLRECLGDQLLVRTPRGMESTPRAERIRPLLREALEQIDFALADEPRFDPKSATDTFVISCGDHIGAVLGQRLAIYFEEHAPGLRVRFHSIAPSDIGDALRTANTDFCIGPDLPTPSGVQTYSLGQDPFVCIVRRGHLAASRRLTLKRFCSLRHIQISPTGRGQSAVDRRLAELGERRTVVMQVESFLAAPHIVANTDLVLTVPKSVMTMPGFGEQFEIRSCPIELKPIRLSLYWDERRQGDARLVWARELLTGPNRIVAGMFEV